MSRGVRWAIQLVIGLLIILGGLWFVGGGMDSGAGDGSSSTHAEAGSTPDSSLETVAESRLPEEGQETLDLIRSDGPFPHDRDGLTFENREQILPSQDRGYYREYTVPTPGADDRGARRIVGGEGGDRYYTEDHYASFRQIEEGT
ncbi:MAG TPA: ribonuclease [Candidatus Janibacter merdipullorum]|nr:ribonuclease [Candidatus Janibacter merdipullorum]